jgi:hypothetical protein
MRNATRRPAVPILIAILLLAPIAAAQEQLVNLGQIAEGGAAGSGELERFTQSVAPAASVVTVQGYTPAPTSETLGEQRTLVTLVNFTNDPSTPYLVADVEDAVLDASSPDSVASWVLEASYGRAWLSGSVQGWFSASYDDSTCLVRAPDGTQALLDELDPSIDFSVVDRWIIVMPQNPTCGFVGLSSLGKWPLDSDEGPVTLSRMVLNGPSGSWRELVTHELGHSLTGLQHDQDWECGLESVGPTCQGVSVDRYDVMGEINNGGHYSAPGKAIMGWLDTNLIDVPAPGGTYLLEPYETTGTGAKVLHIPVHWPVHDYAEGIDYYVSYRKPLGFDAPFAELATDGAMLHMGSLYFPEYGSRYYPDYDQAAVAPSQLLDAKPGTGNQTSDSADVLLEVGQSFVDTEHGITIETLSASAGLLEVRVTIDQYCGNGVADANVGEVCDGADRAGATCASVGFTSGTLGCSASCGYDVSLCGVPQCNAGDTYDLATHTCTASILGGGPVHMDLYYNSATWAFARQSMYTTLLTAARGFFGLSQNYLNLDRYIVHRMQIPFDTSVLPDGVMIESAKLKLKLDAFGSGMENTHPDLADQLVLVQTNDPAPLFRQQTDFGTFQPVDAPPEGAPRIDISDDLSPEVHFEFQLNPTGLSWIDDTGWTKLGLRSGFDVDDVVITPPDELSLKLDIVPPDSPISGPRLEVTYQAVPEPDEALGLLATVGMLFVLARVRRASLATDPRPGKSERRRIRTD